MFSNVKACTSLLNYFMLCIKFCTQNAITLWPITEINRTHTCKGITFRDQCRKRCNTLATVN